MLIKKLLRAGLTAIAVIWTAPVAGSAEMLTIMSGAASGVLNVSTNRAVVVESEEPFAELSIANPGIADISTLSDRTIYVLGKAPGRTTLTLLAPDGSLITNVDVQVSPDTAEYKERLEQILPGENIEVRTANDGIVLSGTVSSTARMDRALDLANRYAPGRVSNLMVVGGIQQVMLQVRFAEVSRSVSKGFSSRFGVDGTAFGGDVAVNGAGIALAPSTTGFLDSFWSGGTLAFELLLDAFEQKGLARTLSEPNLAKFRSQLLIQTVVSTSITSSLVLSFSLRPAWWTEASSTLKSIPLCLRLTRR
jgi:pilus assembly protein CpaC